MARDTSMFPIIFARLFKAVAKRLVSCTADKQTKSKLLRKRNLAKHTGHSRGSKLPTLKESVAEKEWGKFHQDEHPKRGIAEEDWRALGNQWRKPRPACRESPSGPGLPDTERACTGKAS